MRAAYDVASVRAAEAALMAQLPEGTLMQRAAAGLAATCARLLGGVYARRVALLVGSGDNGGDAMYAGARLADRGARVDAVLLSERAHVDARTALLRAGGRAADAGADGVWRVLEQAELVVDGITGIGGAGGLRPDAARLVAAVQARGTPIVAVDLPSGIDADSGQVAGPAVRAAATVTFGALKPGLVVDPGAEHVGALELVDIGLGPHLPAQPLLELLQAGDVAARLPRPAGESDKYRRGVLGVLAGSPTYPGAAALTTGAALRGGAGMVRFVSAGPAVALVRSRYPETVCTEVEPGDGAGVLAVGRVQAWAAGPGLGTDDAAAAMLEAVLSAGLPTVVDADGLTVLSTRPALLANSSKHVLLTPHAGELSRLLGGVDRADIEARRLEHVRRAAQELGVVVLLKGSTTIVAAPDGSARVNPTGTPWLATAGSGDVLTGLAGTLLAGGLEPLEAGSVAAWLHGLAGRLAAEHGPPTAHDVLTALPAALGSASR